MDILVLCVAADPVVQYSVAEFTIPLVSGAIIGAGTTSMYLLSKKNKIKND